MSELDDAVEWANNAGEYSLSKRDSTSLRENQPTSLTTKDEAPTPGTPTQYALHGGGYAATTPTIDRLPAGSYDIASHHHRVFVVPTLPPSGILLELPQMRSEEVVRIVDRFWESEKDYKEGNEFVNGGAIFKAGLMLYGPPGSGKSCTIKIVSKKLVERGGIVFFASTSPMLVSGWFNDFARIEPDRKIIVILEDIDSLIQYYGESAYLELLDSAKTVNNVMFIATTNYPEKLDPRIYNRPGRFSHVVKIGLPTREAREAYLKAILKNHRDVDYIVDNSNNFTIDHLTALINAVYREKKELNNEIKRLRTLFTIPSSEEDKPGMGIIKKDNW
jgi:Cdc6-like AAA superfamily ATPase